MKLILFVTEAGIALLDENKVAIKSTKYFNDPPKSYEAVLNGNDLEELNELLKFAIDNKAQLINPYPEMQKAVSRIVGDAITDPTYKDELESKKLNLMISAGLAGSPQDVINSIRDYSIYVSTKKLREQSSRLDLHAIQIIQAVDELDKTFNLFYMRLREWYGLHFPELSGILVDPATFVNFVVKFPNRNSINKDQLGELNLPQNRTEIILKASNSSKGAEFDKRTTEMVVQLAEITARTYRYRESLSKMLEDVMNEIAPNLTAIAGETIGARLLARAGSLERLAKMPASTIQILGAEKALFRALKTHGRPPKHGLIFQHKLLHDAPKRLRGKIARALATKMAIAARIDFYSGRKESSLAEDLNKRVEEIRKKFSEEKVKPERAYNQRNNPRKGNRRFDKGRRNRIR
ncbi:MAG: C/D box methylation guide ribonucleoprotein complex aNOP56 subunit [Nitrososphaerota archaeon]|nr:C/D box methylation guide ribonucleoprotein complex aNOP56 subunit [Nitrososphaerota archaeon]MDG6927563.1 C/D box methylation guide ribonucleoprotein complex aNOP56 subunit [Nitrososphaerota archaeon]MDG6930663.1 C/D box methylation guide ribonucleoprotein complex aNOP56 subunit [Nitrososphaerota archaeon]MDG6932498.1 C/D box methylation guide ribonucleoprotein complex aNOP56 subunit [Nitrososphaerota archaeon]MDG6936221.1 C/D box methylation guide ribonucleoprotein complex aNOP56 subunit [